MDLPNFSNSIHSSKKLFNSFARLKIVILFERSILAVPTNIDNYLLMIDTVYRLI